jgi:TDG/mug DNA glycosylase family protein
MIQDPQIDDAATLPDYLRQGLDIVLVGLNPSAYSVRVGHYFANPRNRFWAAINAANLVGRTVGPEDDAGLIDDGVGFTDLVKRATPQASGLNAADYRQDAPRLKQKLLRYRPALVCFQGITTYRQYLRYAEGVGRSGEIDLGRQPSRIGNSVVFVAPNPSPANARYSLSDLTDWYARLGALRDELAS